ncbi:hypothetical protein PMIN02_004924 [Paraphaeosphaeria minitans]
MHHSHGSGASVDGPTARVGLLHRGEVWIAGSRGAFALLDRGGVCIAAAAGAVWLICVPIPPGQRLQAAAQPQRMRAASNKQNYLLLLPPPPPSTSVTARTCGRLKLGAGLAVLGAMTSS